MGFLIFAFRKLSLKRQINEKNFRLMMLSNDLQKITSNISTVQQAMSTAQNTMNAFTSNSIMKVQQQYLKADGTPKEGSDQNIIYPAMNVQLQAIQSKTNHLNSIFDQVNKVQLTQLNAMDTKISQQMASLESQLKPLNYELQNVEKAEDEAAKQIAPKFGLSN